MIALRDIIQNDEPNFKGTVICDSQQINLVRELGVTLSWVLDADRLKNIKYLLITGTDRTYKNVFKEKTKEEKGLYFIAEIERIVNMSEYLKQTNGWADEFVRKHHSSLTFPIHEWIKDKRFAIFFTNPTEIRTFSHKNFSFTQNPVLYIESPNFEQENIKNIDTFLDLISLNLNKIIEKRNSITSNQNTKLITLYNKFEDLLKEKQPYLLPKNKIERKIHVISTHFNNIFIEKCKKINNLEINNLNRVNIFAGINNSGKTTLLESIYWLSKQNDIYAFTESWRIRGKFEKLNPSWLNEEFNNNISISGQIANIKTFVRIEKRKNSFNYENDYLADIHIQANYNEIENSSRISLFSEKDFKAEFNEIRPICNSQFTSPFSLQDKDNLIFSHEQSVSNKSLYDIIDFIKENIDNKIQGIELVKTNSGLNFKVAHKDFDKVIDILQFGEGLQRIFHISLLFAAARNGIMLIDELENAIHHSLLLKFTEFIQKLAEKFNVQVFLTSHSKECIEAFIINNYKIENLSFYQLVENDNIINCKYASGTTMQKLMKASKFIDLRGKVTSKEGGEE